MTTFRFGSLLLILGVCGSLPAAPASREKAPAPRPEWVEQIGRYRLVKWRNPAAKPERLPRETLILRDARGRTVARLSDFGANLEYIGDLTGDRTPEVVLYTWTGGAHGSLVYYIYSLGRTPRCLLAYNKGNIDDREDFEPKDLNGDGDQEILSWYDGFAYYHASYGGSARVPLVLGYRNGRYVDVTRYYRRRLRTWLAEAERWLREALARVGPKTLEEEGDFAAVVQWYAIALLLHDPSVTQREMLRRLPQKDRADFRKYREEIEHKVAHRTNRFYYPRPYDTRKLRLRTCARCVPE
jgi:hypothetical protein